MYYSRLKLILDIEVGFNKFNSQHTSLGKELNSYIPFSD